MDDQQPWSYAIGPDGTIDDAVPQPDAQALLSGGITHQIRERTIDFDHDELRIRATGNRGVGGMTLASAGEQLPHHEQQVTYRQQTCSVRHCCTSRRFSSATNANRRPASRRIPASSSPMRSPVAARRRPAANRNAHTTRG